MSAALTHAAVAVSASTTRQSRQSAACVRTPLCFRAAVRGQQLVQQRAEARSAQRAAVLTRATFADDGEEQYQEDGFQERVVQVRTGRGGAAGAAAAARLRARL